MGFPRIAELLRLRRQDRHTVRTMAGAAHVYTVAGPDGAPVRVLEQGGVWQSATYLDERRMEPVFAYYRAFDHLLEAALTGGPALRRVLLLGGGGCAYPKYALTTYPDLAMDVVEVDPAVVAAAREFFFLDELEAQVNGADGAGAVPGGDAAGGAAASRGAAAPAGEKRLPRRRLNLVTADGRAFLDVLAKKNRAAGGAARRGSAGGCDAGGRDTGACGPDCYDAVVNDTFSGAEPVRALATVEALQAARACLAPGGLYAANIVSRDEGADLGFLRDAAASAQEVFAHVHVIPCSDERFGGEDNYLLIATDSPCTFSDAVPFGEEFLGTPLRD